MQTIRSPQHSSAVFQCRFQNCKIKNKHNPLQKNPKTTTTTTKRSVSLFIRTIWYKQFCYGYDHIVVSFISCLQQRNIVIYFFLNHSSVGQRGRRKLNQISAQTTELLLIRNISFNISHFYL